MDYNFDFEQLKSDVKNVLAYSQGFNPESMHIDKLMNDWLTAKEFWIGHLGGDLTYEIPETVSFELDDTVKQDRLARFADQVDAHYANYPLANFLQKLDLSEFYNNKTEKEHTVGNVIIPKNFKVVKAFKFFERDEELLKELQSAASRIIQENIVSGKLVLSVHPLDFLSSSENVHNWRSCHALDGEYRSGNLSYMMDPNTVICYLRAEKQAVLPHFPEDVLWNSKKWRVLMFFSTDQTMLFAGRQYPFTADRGLELIREKILPVIGMGNWSNFYQDKITSYKDEYSGRGFPLNSLIPVGDIAVSPQSLIVDGDRSKQFNDLIRSSFYKPIWAYRKQNFWNTKGTGLTTKDTHFVIGRACTCPICGSAPVEYTEMMACSYCAERCGFDDDDYGTCDCCGSRVYYDELYELPISGDHVCERCYREELAECQRCNNRDWTNIIKYREGSKHCLCPDCYELERIENNGEGNYRERESNGADRIRFWF